MTAIPALLRAAARIARVEAALLDLADESSPIGVFGLSDEAAVDALNALRFGSPLPGGRQVVFEAAVALSDTTRSARLVFLNKSPLKVDERLERSLRLFATELGHEIDVAARTSWRSLHEVVGDRLEQIAESIDAITDPVAIYSAPRIGNIPTYLYVNAAFEQFFGMSALDVIGQTPDIMYGPMTDLDRMDFLHARLHAGYDVRSPVVYYKRDGIPVWVEINARPVIETTGASSYFMVSMRDVTARKEFEAAVAAEKRKLRVTLAAIGDGVITTVGDGRVEFVNIAARDTLWIDPVEAYGEPINKVVELRDADDAVIDVLTAGEEDGAGVRRGEARRITNGEVMHIAFVASPIGSDQEGFVVVLRDVTEQHRLETQLSFEASHDALTGLFNRRRFEETLSEAIASVHDSSSHHTLAFLDLDRFKVVNDRCGHAVGDRVLADIARVLQGCLRGHDVLARLGGDEFAIVLHHCSIANARRVLDKLRLAVDGYSIEHEGERFSVGVSIGLASIEGPAANASEALAAADAACYAAKAAGRNAIVG